LYLANKARPDWEDAMMDDDPAIDAKIAAFRGGYGV
jgi:hypothetical protein